MNLNRAFWLSSAAGIVAVSLLGQTADHGARTPPVQPTPRTSVAAPTNTLATSDYPIVSYIERRGRTIIIKSSPKGPLYSVKTSEGKLLFQNLSSGQLQAKAPELHKFLKTALASGTGKADASLRLGKH